MNIGYSISSRHVPRLTFPSFEFIFQSYIIYIERYIIFHKDCQNFINLSKEMFGSNHEGQSTREPEWGLNRSRNILIYLAWFLDKNNVMHVEVTDQEPSDVGQASITKHIFKRNVGILKFNALLGVVSVGNKAFTWRKVAIILSRNYVLVGINIYSLHR